MRPSEILPKHRETIRRLVLDAGMANPRVFGSVLHGNDNEDSDLDLLVDPGPKTSLMDMVRVQDELEKTIGIKVDLRTPGELHPRFREETLAEAASL
jgi:predicted nucleotidyltransferase